MEKYDLDTNDISNLFIRRIEETDIDDTLNDILLKIPTSQTHLFSKEAVNAYQEPAPLDELEQIILDNSWKLSRPWGIVRVPGSMRGKLSVLNELLFNETSIKTEEVFGQRTFVTFSDCFNTPVLVGYYDIKVYEKFDSIVIRLSTPYVLKIVMLDPDSLSYLLTPMIHYAPLDIPWEYESLLGYFFTLEPRQKIKSLDYKNGLRSLWYAAEMTPNHPLPMIGSERIERFVLGYQFDRLKAKFIIRSATKRAVIRFLNTPTGPRIFMVNKLSSPPRPIGIASID